ncbi:MAG: hypothetical protein MUC38_15245 [Cyclobacteriaceae bacterium]|nr:hypothetical protein [Cyclobacteriaceae bacterium]
MKTSELKPSFSNLQLELLKIYSNGISDEQLMEIKTLLANYFAEKGTQAMDKFIEDQKLTAEDLGNRAKEHHRSANRT